MWSKWSKSRSGPMPSIKSASESTNASALISVVRELMLGLLVKLACRFRMVEMEQAEIWSNPDDGKCVGITECILIDFGGSGNFEFWRSHVKFEKFDPFNLFGLANLTHLDKIIKIWFKLSRIVLFLSF